MIYSWKTVKRFFLIFSVAKRHGRCSALGVRFNRSSQHQPGSPEPARIAPRRTSISFRWAVQDNSLQMLPPAFSKRTFKWSYLLSRTLRRLHPGSYL